MVTAALADRSMRYVSIGVPRAFIHAYGEPEDLDADVGLDEAGIGRTCYAVCSDALSVSDSCLTRIISIH